MRFIKPNTLVVPAQAGVILCNEMTKCIMNCGPRTGGGDPWNVTAKNGKRKWSPHRRG